MSAARSVASRLERRWLALALAVGSTSVVAGALAPWLTLFAGLRTLPGVAGLYGRLVLAAGLVLLAGAMWYAHRADDRVLRVLVVVSVSLTAFCLWLVPRQIAVRDRLLSGAMIVPALGPGVFIALAGAALATASALLAWRVERRARPA